MKKLLFRLAFSRNINFSKQRGVKMTFIMSDPSSFVRSASVDQSRFLCRSHKRSCRSTAVPRRILLWRRCSWHKVVNCFDSLSLVLIRVVKHSQAHTSNTRIVKLTHRTLSNILSQHCLSTLRNILFQHNGYIFNALDTQYYSISRATAISRSQ